MDLILWPGERHCLRCPLREFQSLFWWILYYDTTFLIFLDTDCPGFNPCFGGSYIMTGMQYLLLTPRTVSILVLVDLILWHLTLSGIMFVPLCFNPCFGGSYIMTCNSWQRITGNRCVSILVLVDLILWLFIFYLIFFYDYRFNPCFGGSYIMTMSAK